MKFLVDAHLPFGLCALLASAGHESVHTRDLPQKNQTTDSSINEISMREQRVVITKDTDFYHSHLLHGEPWKLVLVRTGNVGARELVALFERYLRTIVTNLETNTLIELYRDRINIIA